jgi:hypothetical protein
VITCIDSSLKNLLVSLSPLLDSLATAMQHLSIKVRYMGYHPIKSRVPLLLSGPVNLFPFQFCNRTSKAELSLFKLDLGYGLQGYLIPIVLHTLVGKRQLLSVISLHSYSSKTSLRISRLNESFYITSKVTLNCEFKTIKYHLSNSQESVTQSIKSDHAFCPFMIKNAVHQCV